MEKQESWKSISVELDSNKFCSILKINTCQMMQKQSSSVQWTDNRKIRLKIRHFNKHIWTWTHSAHSSQSSQRCKYLQLPDNFPLQMLSNHELTKLFAYLNTHSTLQAKIFQQHEASESVIHTSYISWSNWRERSAKIENSIHIAGVYDVLHWINHQDQIKQWCSSNGLIFINAIPHQEFALKEPWRMDS